MKFFHLLAFFLISLLLTACYSECQYANGSKKPDTYLSVQLQNRSAQTISQVFYPQVNQYLTNDTGKNMKLPLLNGFNTTTFILIYQSQKRDTLQFNYTKSLRYDESCELLIIQPNTLTLVQSTCDSLIYQSSELILYK